MMDKLKQFLRPVPAGTVLSPEDLQEFTLRRTTLNNAKFQALMVEEAYLIWSKNLRQKYGLPVKFEIDPTTGIVTPKEDA